MSSQPPSDTIALLLQQPPAARITWLRAAIRKNAYDAFDIVPHVFADASTAQQFVDETLEEAGAGTIRLWLTFNVERQGYERTVDLIEHLYESRPKQARFAAYWMCQLPGADTLRGRARVAAFEAWYAARRQRKG